MIIWCVNVKLKGHGQISIIIIFIIIGLHGEKINSLLSAPIIAHTSYNNFVITML